MARNGPLSEGLGRVVYLGELDDERAHVHSAPREHAHVVLHRHLQTPERQLHVTQGPLETLVVVVVVDCGGGGGGGDGGGGS